MISPITQSFNKDAKDSANSTHNDTSSTTWYQPVIVSHIIL